jgi:hypothetical protein
MLVLDISTLITVFLASIPSLALSIILGRGLATTTTPSTLVGSTGRGTGKSSIILGRKLATTTTPSTLVGSTGRGTGRLRVV